MQFTHNKLNQIIGRPGGGLVRFEGTLDEPGAVSVEGVAARMRTVPNDAGSPEFRFSADVALEEGLNRVSVIARDGSGNEVEELYDVDVTGQAGQGVPAYDSRGNMTSNGRGQSYEWDAANRLLAIGYTDGSRTEFTYDALGRRMREVEMAGGTVLSDKRLLWCGFEICQERDAANAVIKRYGPHGFIGADGNKRFYARDHLGSVTHLTDDTGKVIERHHYDPYGVQAEPEPEPQPVVPFPNLWSLQIRLRADQHVIKDASNKVSEWRNGPSADVLDVKAPNSNARPTWVGDAIRFDGNDDVLEGALGVDSHDWDLTIFVVHRRQAAAPGASPLSFSVPVPVNNPDSPAGALALAWNNAWQDAPGTMTAGIGAASTGPSGTTWTGPAAESAPGQAGFQITTLTKANTVAVNMGTWTNSADLTLRNRNLLGATENSKAVTTTVPGGAPRYALGRLLVDAGVGQGFLHGDIAEVIVFIEALSAADRQAVEDHLASVYLPSTTVAKRQSDFRYTGHYFHEKSGLHLAPYRAYDAKLGVWISEDPIQEAGGINLYGYVGNSPSTMVDPLGLLEWLPGTSEVQTDFLKAPIARDMIAKVEEMEKATGQKLKITCQAFKSIYNPNTKHININKSPEIAPMSNGSRGYMSYGEIVAHEMRHYMDDMNKKLNGLKSETQGPFVFDPCPDKAEEAAMHTQNLWTKSYNEAHPTAPRPLRVGY